MNEPTMRGPTPRTLAQLEELVIERGRPLIVVDVDDCISIYIDHLNRYLAELGFDLRLTSYQLEGSIFPTGTADPLPFDDCIELLNRFFQVECRRQELMPGAAEALQSMAGDAQIVILTNAPHFAGDDRRANLAELGIPGPVVTNTGGKGRALAWLSARAGAPTAFIDDSVHQIESVARHAPHVLRLHFMGAQSVQRLFPDCADASAQVRNWQEAEAVLRRELPLPKSMTREAERIERTAFVRRS